MRKPPASSLKANEAKQRQRLKDQKVVDHELILLTGLSDRAANETQLARPELLGQYGAIRKISINRDKLGGRDRAEHIQTYVTFTNELAASLAILALDGFEWEGKALRATFGTNKYCPSFVRGFPCGNSDCLYLHRINAEQDGAGGEDMPLQRAASRLTLASFVDSVLPRWRAPFKAKAEEPLLPHPLFPSAAVVIARVRQYVGDRGLSLEPRPAPSSGKKGPKRKETAGKRSACPKGMLWSADEEEGAESADSPADESVVLSTEAESCEENTLIALAGRLTELDQQLFASLSRSLNQLRCEQPAPAALSPQPGHEEMEILQNIRQFCEKLETGPVRGSASENDAEFQLFHQTYLVEQPPFASHASN